MAKKKKRAFDIELLDTRQAALSPKKLVWRGIKQGRYPKEALRNVAKMFPGVDLSEWRDPKKKRYSRYVFLWEEINACMRKKRR